MSWEAIDAVSSLVSAVGVIATLIYLAYQIRQNTQSIQGATEQSLMVLEKDTYSLMAEHADVFVRGSADFSQLSPEDAIKFQNIVGAELSLVYSAYVQYNRKLIPLEAWEAYERSTADYFKGPGYLAAWQALKPSYPERFCEAMEKVERMAQ
jgi:hypothetical protein